MIIYTDNVGNIKYSSIDLEEGLNFIGEIKGKVDGKELMVTHLSEHEKQMIDIHMLKYIYGDATILYIQSNKLKYIYPNICGERDIFFAQRNTNEYIFSDNFYEIAHEFAQLNVNKSALQFFIAHGYFLPGETYFKEISRLRAGNILMFNNNLLIEQSVFGDYGSNDILARNDKDKYDLFKSSIESVFAAEDISDDDAILLSGGSDSGLMTALSFDKFSKKPTLITMKYKQELDINYDDVIRAKNIAGYYGASHDIVELDFDKSSTETLEIFIRNMPLAAHLSIGFYNIARKINQLGGKRLWCGQNADSVYNLGPTTRLNGLSGMGDMIKRFYLSKEYFATLPDISQNKIMKPFVRTAGYLCSKLLSYKYHTEFKQPNNFRELMNSFLNSDQYLALKVPDSEIISPFASPVTTLGARQMIFEEKLSSYIVGRDPRAVYCSADCFSLDAVLPFSAANMILFFRSLEMSFADVFHPKRYIYKYLRELIGWKTYNKLYLKPLKRKNDTMKYNQWEEYIIKNTSFGQQLINELFDHRCSGNNLTESNNLQQLLSQYWYLTLKKMISEQGTEIIEYN